MDLPELIRAIRTGEREEVKRAQKEVEALWKNLRHPLSARDKRRFEIFLEAVKDFDDIPTDANKAAFLNTLKWPFLAIGEEHFQFFAAFLILAIQHPSGVVRQAMIRAADWLLLANVVDIDQRERAGLTKEQRAVRERQREIFCHLVYAVECLLAAYDRPEYERIEYVSDLPSSVYKSLQKLVTETLLRSPHYTKIYWQFMKEHGESLSRGGGMFPHEAIVALSGARRPDPHTGKSVRNMEIRDQRQIERRREEIERELKKLLEQAGSDATVEDIRGIVYREEDSDDMMKIVALFDTGDGAVELSTALEAASDAWNYFPHETLRGLSPAEKVLEYQQRSGGKEQ